MPAEKIKNETRELKAVEKENFEITYLQKKFLVSRQKVEEAMKKNGNNRQLVEAYLTKYTTQKPGMLL